MKLIIFFNFFYLFNCIPVIYYDDIEDEIELDSISSRNKWNKKYLSWNLANSTTLFEYWDTVDIISKAFNEWESISPLNFMFLNSLDVDMLIYFADLKHNISEKDRNFGEGVLAHAFYPNIQDNGKATPQSGDIHFNNNVNWSLSSNNGISLFHTALHEIGHAIGLSHSINETSIMYPFYITRDDDFKLNDSFVDVNLIKYKYKDFEPSTSTTSTTSTTTSTTTTSTTSEEPTSTPVFNDKKANFHCSCWYD